MYALTMFIHYLNHTHKMPYASPGLIFRGAYIQTYIWGSLLGGLYLGGYLLYGICLFSNAIKPLKNYCESFQMLNTVHIGICNTRTSNN